MIEAKVIEDSVSVVGKRITTLQVKFHRFILPEFNTHRVFSRNFSSSRAIPTAKLIEQVRSDPATPVHWGKNQAGMQANEELDELTMRSAKLSWASAAQSAASMANIMSQLGTHKQIVNRILEPYMWVHGVVTSTEWDNWFELRDHEDAQPEIHALAIAMREAIDQSTPTFLPVGNWHLPYILPEEREAHAENILMNVSAARCCRVSYLKHDGGASSIEEDLALCERLVGARPLHASPFEHQATPDPFDRLPELHGNFNGWIQNRKMIENATWSYDAII